MVEMYVEVGRKEQSLIEQYANLTIYLFVCWCYLGLEHSYIFEYTQNDRKSPWKSDLAPFAIEISSVAWGWFCTMKCHVRSISWISSKILSNNMTSELKT